MVGGVIVATRSASRTRGIWWAAFGVLALVNFAVTQMPLSAALSRILSDGAILFAPIVLTAGLGVLLTRRVEGVDRRFWGLLTLAVVFEGCSEAYWTSYAAFIDPRGPAIPHWMELGQLAALIILTWLIVSMTTLGDAAHSVRARFYLDVACLAAVLYAAIYWWVTVPLFATLHNGMAIAAVAAVCSVVGVLLLSSVGLMSLGWKAYRWRSWERIVTLAFAVYAIGLIANPWLYASITEATPPRGFDALSVALGFGYYLIFMAMVYRWTEGADAAPAQPWGVPEVRPAWLPALYPMAMWLALVGLAVLAFANGAAETIAPVIGAALALGMLLVVRSWVSSVELAHHRTASVSDPMTGAYNSRYFRDTMARTVADGRESGREFALVVFDIVDLAGVNARFGRGVGDHVLRSLAHVLAAEASDSVPVCRLMRDDFVLVVSGTDDAELVDLAHRVAARMSTDVELEGTNAQLSVGIARFPEHGADTDTLLEHAHAALVLAGAAGFTDVVVYDPEIAEAADPLERLSEGRTLLHRSRLRALAAAVDRRYAETRSHSDKVGELACALALMLDLPEDEAIAVEAAARLHDIGMIGVSDEVMQSVDTLTDEGCEAVQEHPVLGARMLQQAQLEGIAVTVRHHHERWDGTGYPDRLAEQDIPLAARILSLCDAFDAMVSPRSYREPRVIAVSRCTRGSQFDPVLAGRFIQMVSAMKAQPGH